MRSSNANGKGSVGRSRRSVTMFAALTLRGAIRVLDPSLEVETIG